jgi:inward rectifier potassium channel
MGLLHFPWQDLYHWLLTLPWFSFFLLIAGVYIGTNLLFALAYLADGNAIANAQPGSLPDAFFFSIQTMATIGYGAMYPKTPYAHVLVAIESLVGLLGVAMATGLMFARFSRPTARVLFSRVAVITTYDGVPALMFRAANQRSNQILEARLWVTLARDEVTVEGHTMRRIYDLKLLRSHSPFFALSWTAIHPIDENSPFYGETPESLAEKDTEVLVTLTGTDETVAQPIHARHSYFVREILWNMRFVDIFSKTADGYRMINYDLLHDVTSV